MRAHTLFLCYIAISIVVFYRSVLAFLQLLPTTYMSKTTIRIFPFAETVRPAHDA